MTFQKRPRCMAVPVLALIGLLSILPVMAGAQVPPRFRGAWAIAGRCAALDSRLVISDRSARLGRAKAAPVILARQDGPNGEDALHWVEEGDVDNFVAGPKANEILHNLEGFGMGRTEIYERCRR